MAFVRVVLSRLARAKGVRIFRERERLRLFTYWEMLRYLQAAGFKDVKCYLDMEIEPLKKPKAEWLVFVSRKPETHADAERASTSLPSSTQILNMLDTELLSVLGRWQNPRW